MDMQLKEKTIIFPSSFYSECVGSLSVSCPKSDVIIRDDGGEEVVQSSFDENQKPFTRNYDINASVSVLFFPNSQIAEAAHDKILEWKNLGDREYGYLRSELARFEPNLAEKKGLIQRIANMTYSPT